MSIPRFTPRQLDACIAAAELSNFTRAATRLHLTPSAISNLITELEQSLGFAIFERTTRKVVLTAAGREFLPSALAVQRQIARAQSAAADIRDQATDVVRIAAPMAIAATLLPPLLVDFKRRHPRVTVGIVDTAVEWLGDRVAIGEAHLAIGPARPSSGDFNLVTLFESEWVLWLSPDDDLVHLPRMNWEDIAQRRLFAAGRDHEDMIAPQINAAAKKTVMPKIEVVESIATAMGMTAVGLGVTFSPRYVEPLAAKLGVVSRLVGSRRITREVGLYTSQVRSMPGPAQDLATFLIEKLSDK